MSIWSVKLKDLTNQLSCNYKTKYKEVLDVHVYIRDREDWHMVNSCNYWLANSLSLMDTSITISQLM